VSAGIEERAESTFRATWSSRNSLVPAGAPRIPSRRTGTSTILELFFFSLIYRNEDFSFLNENLQIMNVPYTRFRYLEVVMMIVLVKESRNRRVFLKIDGQII